MGSFGMFSGKVLPGHIAVCGLVCDLQFDKTKGATDDRAGGDSMERRLAAILCADAQLV